MPFSISTLASSSDSLERSLCDQVWLPMVWPAASTCLRISGAHMVCWPIGKKTALVQWAASAARTSCVLCGQGPSSKVSTTSPGCRKSYCLKCSKPKPGPPVVSISTTRETPNALLLPGQLIGAAAGGGAAAGAAGGVMAAAAAMADAAGCAGAGAAAGATAGAGAGATAATVCAGLGLVVAALSVEAETGFAAGAEAAGAEATTGVVALC